MDSTISTGAEENVWGGGNQPLGASYGKLMMWFQGSSLLKHGQ
jgi:cytochrome c oxidase subunit 3